MNLSKISNRRTWRGAATKAPEITACKKMQ